jgi:hypothetical protein
MKPTCVTLESPLVVVKSQFFLNHNFSQINHSQISNSAESPNFIQYDYYSWWNSQLLAGLLPAIIYLSWVLDGWASIKPYEKHMKSIWKAYMKSVKPSEKHMKSICHSYVNHFLANGYFQKHQLPKNHLPVLRLGHRNLHLRPTRRSCHACHEGMLCGLLRGGALAGVANQEQLH